MAFLRGVVLDGIELFKQILGWKVPFSKTLDSLMYAVLSERVPLHQDFDLCLYVRLWERA